MPFFKHNGQVYFLDPKTGDLFQQQFYSQDEGLSGIGSFFKKIGKVALGIVPIAASILIPGAGAVAQLARAGISAGASAAGGALASSGGGGGGVSSKDAGAALAQADTQYSAAIVDIEHRFDAGTLDAQSAMQGAQQIGSAWEQLKASIGGALGGSQYFGNVDHSLTTATQRVMSKAQQAQQTQQTQASPSLFGGATGAANSSGLSLSSPWLIGGLAVGAFLFLRK